MTEMLHRGSCHLFIVCSFRVINAGEVMELVLVIARRVSRVIVHHHLWHVMAHAPGGRVLGSPPRGFGTKMPSRGLVGPYLRSAVMGICSCPAKRDEHVSVLDATGEKRRIILHWTERKARRSDPLSRTLRNPFLYVLLLRSRRPCGGVECYARGAVMGVNTCKA